jgi:DNA-binding MarR family transcriptional regulator
MSTPGCDRVQVTDWLNDAEMRAWRGYRRLRVLLDLQLARDLAADSGLSEADYDVLSTVSESGGARMRLIELARDLHWSKSRLSHHLTRMQQRGLVDRQEDLTIALTEAGWRTIRAAAPAHVASVRRHLIDRLTEEQLRVLGDIADTVVPNLRDIPH